MAEKVITTSDASFQAFRDATAHAQQKANAAEAAIQDLQAEKATVTGFVDGQIARVDQALAETEQARLAALVAGGVAPEYASPDADDPPAATVDGTRGQRLTAAGDVQVLEWQGGAWVPVGAPLPGVEGLRRRQGWNLLDFAHLATRDAGGTVTDWQPALAAMTAAANRNDILRIPPGDYPIRAPWVQDMEYVYDCRGATLVATGPAFLPTIQAKPQGYVAPTRDNYRYWDIHEYRTPHPAMVWWCTAGNGSFGDNVDTTSRVLGYLPDVRRAGNTAAFDDGSIGYLFNNLYFPHLHLGNTINFTIGAVWDCKRTGSEWRGSSHGTYIAAHHRNRVNELWIGRENYDTNQTDAGWVTTNRVVKGAYGSPYPDAASAPDEHIHVVMIARHTSYQYSNVHQDSYFENHAVQAFLGIGPINMNALLFGQEGIGGYELPNAALRGKKHVEVRPDPERPNDKPIGNLFEGLEPLKLLDLGVGTKTTFNTVWASGWYQSGVSYVLDTRNNISPAVTTGPEWVAVGPRKSETVVYNGQPITLDLGLARDWYIIANADLTADAVTLVGAPTLAPVDVRIMVRQAAGAGVAYGAGWLKGVRFGPVTERPAKRNMQHDLWHLTNYQYSQLAYWTATGYASDEAGSARQVTPWGLGGVRASASNDTSYTFTGLDVMTGTGTRLGGAGVKVNYTDAEYAYLGVAGDPAKWLTVDPNGWASAVRVSVSEFMKVTPKARGSLISAPGAGAGSIATLTNPEVGKSNIVYSDGTNWLYMDGTVMTP